MGILKAIHVCRHIVLLPALCLPLLITMPQAQATSALQMQEKKIKAGLIYNFLKYSDWHETQQGPTGIIRVCLLGGDPFDGYLFPLQGRTAKQQRIEIIKLNSEKFADQCSVAVLDQSLRSALPILLPALHRQNIMTISDIDGFSRAGGMVEFAKGKDKRIHLHINQTATKLAGIEIQERLLKLADHIE